MWSFQTLTMIISARTPTPMLQTIALKLQRLSIPIRIKTNHYNMGYKSMDGLASPTSQALCHHAPLWSFQATEALLQFLWFMALQPATGFPAEHTLPSLFPSLNPTLPSDISSSSTFSGKPSLFSLKDQMLLTSQLQFFIHLGVYW